MKKMKSLTLLVIIFLLIGCNPKDTASQKKSSATTGEIKKESTKDTKDSNQGKDSATVLNKCLELLGKNDKESIQYFDGGKQNFTEDKKYLIGRIFNIKIFDEDTTVSTSYDENGNVNSLNISLSKEDFKYYKGLMIDSLGEATKINDSKSEVGSTYIMWEKEGKQIYLYNTYGLISINMILPNKS